MNTHLTLSQLGWRPFFQQQLSLDEYEETISARVTEHHRSGFTLATQRGEIVLNVSPSLPDITVGDWLQLNKEHRFIRVLDRLSCFSRKAAGSKLEEQLIAANVDRAFIVSSLNHDFNLSRFERFLAITNEARVEPIIVLTKVDQCQEPEWYVQQIHDLDSRLMVEKVNALNSESVSVLTTWCGIGQTVVFMGSSGVGKSTLINTLLGNEIQQTRDIREDDSKGRHTTTGRSLHIMPTGGLLLDTPGMRELQLTSCADGISETFSDIAELEKQCRFCNCKHQSEPQCAVRAALEAGTLGERRFHNYQKLLREQAYNGASLAEKRANDRARQKFYKRVINENKMLKLRK